jgi:hypothetical protein
MIYGANGPPRSAVAAANGVDLFGGGTLTNDGLIGGGGGTSGAGIGVSVASSTVFNGMTAAIRGGYYGGTGLAATASYILNAGEIDGGYSPTSTSGVGVILTASTLINTGSILGFSPGMGAARLYAGSTLVNSGGISGSARLYDASTLVNSGGISGSARLYDASTLVNSGRISGPAGAWAIYVASGSVTNATGGSVFEDQYAGQGVDLSSGATLINQGFIGLHANYTIEGSVGGTGVLLASGAVLTNTGTIDGMGSATTLAGGTGVVVVDDSFTNAGIINGGAGDGAVPYSAGFGTIAGHGGAGVSLNGGSVTNNGSITGGEAFGTAGATDGPGVLVIAGSLTNNATIAGGGNHYSHYAPDVLGGAGVELQAGAVVNNGTVLGGDQYGGLGAGADISGGSFTNNGTLSGGDGIDVVTGGAGGIYIDNAGSIAGSGADGVSMAVAASVVNSGQITGQTVAVAISAGGSFTNAASGTLVGGAAGVTAGIYGVFASAAATVVNLGKIAMGYIFGTGVDLSAGGTVVNGSPTDKTASVAGATDGIGIVVTGGSLANYGVVTTGGFSPTVQTAGVLLTASSGTNQGTIVGGAGSGGAGAVDSGTGHVGYTGGAGIVLTNSTLTNSGTLMGGIGGEGGYGVYGTAASAPGGPGGLGAVLNSGMLVNTGTLVGGTGGTGGAHGINSGEIPNSPNGPGGGGVSVTAGLLTNAGTAVGAASTGGGVSGGYGVALSGGTLVNTGLVAGGAGTAGPEGGLGGVVLVGGVGGTALVQTGGTASNTGTIVGGSGTYEVAGGAGVWLTGGSFTNAGLVEGANAGPGGFYSSPGGTGLYLTGATATNAGTIIGGAEGMGSIASGGAPGAAVVFGSAAATLVVDPGAVFSGSVVANTSAGDTLELGAGTGAGILAGLGGTITGFGTIAFDAGAPWTLLGTAPALAAGQSITGFAMGDTIDLQNELFGALPALDPSANALTISGGGNSVTLDIAGATADHFSVTTDAATTGTDLTVQCFLEGTRIRTGRGDMAVEALAIGDLVQTGFSGMMPVQWLGYRRIDCRRHPKPVNVWPVRVRAGAFGEGRPHRDLWLSPDHAVFIDGVLIPIRYLVNGRTIAQEPRDAVTYWHVELGQHNVILAEGLPCESYLDTGNRGAFANGGAAVQMHADFARGVWEAEACAPLVLEGAEREAAHSWLLARAETLGHVLTHDPGLRLIADENIMRPQVIGRTRRFQVPRGAKDVRLVSRSAVPAQVRDDSTDHRRLGIALSRVIYDGKRIPLTDPCFGSGWYDAEYGNDDVTWRWTDGDGGLVVAGGHVLDIEVAMTERYWLTEPSAASDSIPWKTMATRGATAKTLRGDGAGAMASHG